MDLLATQWLLCLFSTSVPACSLFRLWDLLFLEGSQAILAACIAVCELLQVHKDPPRRVCGFLKYIPAVDP